MSDTVRDKSAFLDPITGAFKDNQSAAITAQDLRDFAESMSPPFASYDVTTDLVTTCTDQNTWYKAGIDSGATEAHNLRNCTHTSPNKLTYTDAPTVHVHMALSLSAAVSANNQTIGFGIGHNGVIESASELERKIAVQNDVGSLALHWDNTVSQDDYLELYVRNVTSAGKIVTITFGYMFFMGMFV